MAVPADTDLRMEMSDRLRKPGPAPRLMAQDHPLQFDFIPALATAKSRRFGIVIAADPGPLFGQGADGKQSSPIRFHHPIARPPVLKTVAETNHPTGTVVFDRVPKTKQRVVAVEPWDKPPPLGGAGTLFEMKIGDEKNTDFGKKCDPAIIENDGMAAETNADESNATVQRLVRSALPAADARRLSRTFVCSSHQLFVGQARGSFNSFTIYPTATMPRGKPSRKNGRHDPPSGAGLREIGCCLGGKGDRPKKAKAGWAASRKASQETAL